MRLKPIGHIESPYMTKFGVPRQPGLADAIESRLVFEPAFSLSEDKRGLDCDDWLVIVWSFSHNLSNDDDWSRTVRPPLLGGTQRMGVFATRSSYRPNGLALSCVRISGLDTDAIRFKGGDMVDGTPVYYIQSYDSETDAYEEARSGWAGQLPWPKLDRVEIPHDLIELVPVAMREGLLQVLLQDPRPAYARKGQEEREFWTAFGDQAIWFTVVNRVAHVTRIECIDSKDALYMRKTGNLPL